MNGIKKHKQRYTIDLLKGQVDMLEALRKASGLTAAHIFRLGLYAVARAGSGGKITTESTTGTVSTLEVL